MLRSEQKVDILSPYDIVIGYRADDSYFSFAQDFVAGTISLQKLQRAMYLGDLGKQIVIVSKKAFEQLSFLGAYEADASVFFGKKNDREMKARKAYREDKKAVSGIDELYMLDIMRGNITNGDSRIQ